MMDHKQISLRSIKCTTRCCLEPNGKVCLGKSFSPFHAAQSFLTIMIDSFCSLELEPVKKLAYVSI